MAFSLEFPKRFSTIFFHCRSEQLSKQNTIFHRVETLVHLLSDHFIFLMLLVCTYLRKTNQFFTRNATEFSQLVHLWSMTKGSCWDNKSDDQIMQSNKTLQLKAICIKRKIIVALNKLLMNSSDTFTNFEIMNLQKNFVNLSLFIYFLLSM